MPSSRELSLHLPLLSSSFRFLKNDKQNMRNAETCNIGQMGFHHRNESISMENDIMPPYTEPQIQPLGTAGDSRYVTCTQTLIVRDGNVVWQTVPKIKQVGRSFTCSS